MMIMDLQLAAHGLNLSTASRVYFVQQCWSGAIESQAIKRAHRIGQTRPVKVEVLVLKDSIEEAIYKRRMNLTGTQLGDTKLITDDSVLRTAIKNPKFLLEPETRTMVTPSFPLFYIGGDTGEGDQDLAPIEPEDLTPTKSLRAADVLRMSPVLSRSSSPMPTQVPRPVKRARFAEDDSSVVSKASSEVYVKVKLEDTLAEQADSDSIMSGCTKSEVRRVENIEAEAFQSTSDENIAKKTRKKIRFDFDAPGK